MGFLANKKALIVGVASKRSIAWGIAEAMYREGATLGYTYQNDKLKGRVQELAERTASDLCLPLDVSSDEQIRDCMAAVAKHWDGLDTVIHAVGFAPRDQLAGGYTESTTREGFQIAHDISSYSFTALAKAAAPMLVRSKGSLLTLSYLGAVQAVPNYNVMGPAKASLEASVRFLAYDLGPQGVRVNGISAGPIKTLAAAGIAGFRKMLRHVENAAPLRRNVSAEEVGNVAAFLCSDLAAGITGEIVYVDAGFHSVGMAFED